jgi:bifunctional enzyme CysN/CysC
VASGIFRVGEEVTVLPSGFTTRIAAIDTFDGPVEEAAPPTSVVLRFEDDLDISRGDMVSRPHNQPMVGHDIDAIVTWMSEDIALRPGDKYAIKHTTRWARALVTDLQYRFDVTTLHRDHSATELSLNEIGRLRLRTTIPLFFDEYRRNRATGSFILVDEATNNTVGAGMIGGPAA